MSVKVMGRVWDADLKPNLKLVLLAYADAAEHDGTEIWPGWEDMEIMTSYSRPSVARLTAELLAIGILIQVKKGHIGQRASYEIDMSHPRMRVSHVDTLPPDPERVSNQTERVSNQGERVSPVIPLPSSTPVLSSRPTSEAQRATNRHDKLVYALIFALEWNLDEITQPTWGRLHKAAKDLEAVEADPNEVARRAQVYRVNYRGATISPNAIAANWADLAEPRRPVSTADVEAAARKADMAQWVADTTAEEAASEAMTP